MLLLPFVKMLELQWSNILVAKVYAEDLTLIVRGVQSELVDRMVLLLNFVIDHLQGTLNMQVSKEKSNTVSEKPGRVAAIAQQVVDGVVKAANHAKILGADTVGGAKRCTYQPRIRLWQFKGKVARFHSLREVGADVVQMVRAVAAPSMLYAVECIGISCTALQRVRGVVVTACFATVGGKDVDLVWALIDGASGTADPTFDAHNGPIKYWALE